MWNRFTLVLITVLSINACSTINCLASGSSPERVLSKQVNGMIGSNFCRSEKYQTSFYEYIFNDLKLFDGNNLFKNNDIYIVEKIVGSTTLIYVLIGDNIAKYKNERKYSNRRHLLWSKLDCKLIYFNKILGVIGKQKCNDFGKMICSKIGNNGTMFSATRVQYYWQQSCSTSKGSIFLIDSSFFK